MLTATQHKKTQTMLTQYAKEPVTVEPLSGALYVFGSELACLRIFAKYQSNGTIHNQKVRVGYSTNHGTWFVCIET